MGELYFSEAGKAIRESEETFIDGSKLVVFLIDEKVS